MFRLFSILTAALFVSAVSAGVDPMSFQENRLTLWYDGVEKVEDVSIYLGEQKASEEISGRVTQLPEELSIPLSTL